MRTSLRSVFLGLPALTMVLALAAGESHAYDETHAYGVANFGGSGECSGASTHSIHEDTADAFDDHFDDLVADGDWNQSYQRNNTSVRGSYWTDSSKAGDCSCTADDTRASYGADEADVIFIHTHGSHKDGASTNYSKIGMGNSSYDCWVRTDDNMLFNSDLEIAVIKACQSGDYEVWQNGGYRQQITTTSSSFTMWNAFHGDSSCGSKVKRYVKRYAEDSDSNGVGENWIDEAYDKDWGSNNDDCPVSIVFGSTSSKRENMYEWGGWRDRKDTGSKTGSTIFYIGGCDPSSGISLPE